MTDDSNDLRDEEPEAIEGDELREPEEEAEEPAPKSGRAERGGGRAGGGSLAATARRFRPGPLPRSHGAEPSSAGGRRGRGLSVDPSLRIQDRVSQAFVIGAVLVYAAIFFNAMAFGRGGAFTGTPVPSLSAGPSASFLASPTVAPTSVPTAAPTAIPAPSAAPTATPAPSAAPGAS